MTITTYDIFELAKDLKKAGVNDAVIDAQVKFEKAKDEAMLNTLATKNDLRQEIDIVKKDIIIWLGGINTALAGVIIAVMAYLK